MDRQPYIGRLGGSGEPVGSIRTFATTPGAKWSACDGGVIADDGTAYPALAKILGVVPGARLVGFNAPVLCYGWVDEVTRGNFYAQQPSSSTWVGLGRDFGGATIPNAARSTDGGDTWTATSGWAFPGGAADAGDGNYYPPERFVFALRADGRIYAFQSRSHYDVESNSNGNFYFRVDRANAMGAAWTQLANPPTWPAVGNGATADKARPAGVAWCSAWALYVLANCFGEIWTSPDLETWTKRYTPAANLNAQAVRFLPVKGRCYVWGSSGTFAYSDDGLAWAEGSAGTAALRGNAGSFEGYSQGPQDAPGGQVAWGLARSANGVTSWTSWAPSTYGGLSADFTGAPFAAAAPTFQALRHTAEASICRVSPAASTGSAFPLSPYLVSSDLTNWRVANIQPEIFGGSVQYEMASHGPLFGTATGPQINLRKPGIIKPRLPGGAFGRPYIRLKD